MRVKKGMTAHRRHHKILKLAKGYRGARHRQFKKANESLVTLMVKGFFIRIFIF